MLGVKLDKNKCTDCGLCISVCKMDIKRVGDHECIHCGACISVCPTKAITWKGSQFFVRENNVDMPADTEIKPIASMLKPKTETSAKVEKMATALGCTPSFLMGWEDENGEPQEVQETYYINDDAREMAQFLFENPEYKVLFDASRKVSKEDIATVKAIMDRFGSNQ
jgi:ferredoxin